MQHVYLIPYILYDCAVGLPYGGMVCMLGSGTTMPSPHALCSVCIYRVGVGGTIEWDDALWLLGGTLPIVRATNQLHIAPRSPSI